MLSLILFNLRIDTVNSRAAYIFPLSLGGVIRTESVNLCKEATDRMLQGSRHQNALKASFKSLGEARLKNNALNSVCSCHPLFISSFFFRKVLRLEEFFASASVISENFDLL